MPPFKPKQHVTLSAADLAELQGDVSQQAIQYFLKLGPPITSTSVIHDNACGAGAVTEVILTSQPPPPSGLHIHATDINEQFVAGTQAMAEGKGWPVTAQVMDARKLSFEDNFFTQSFTAFAFHCMPGREEAVREIHRTLQPGGTAVAAIWTDLPFTAALQQAHWATRGHSAELPAMLEDPGHMPAPELAEVLRSGGFEDVQTYEVVAKMTISSGLERWSNLAWSYLATRQGLEAWTAEDEEKWDEAIRVIVGELQKEGRTGHHEDGTPYIRLVGCAAVGQK